jgi:G:T-mismatch repair DNA endonuclease (very short patch repair protein)
VAAFGTDTIRKHLELNFAFGQAKCNLSIVSDQQNKATLKDLGWRVAFAWEFDPAPKHLTTTTARIAAAAKR